MSLFSSRRIIHVLLYVFLPCSGIQAKELILIDNHVPHAVIVLPAQATHTEKFAAEELRYYLYKVAGIRLPLANDQMDFDGTWVFANGRMAIRENGAGVGVTTDGVRILLGQTKFMREWGIEVAPGERFPDPVLIQTRGNDVIIAGKGDRGTMFGVYQFLEEFVGVRWVMPGELGEVIPVNGTVTVSEMNKTYKPSFEIRNSSARGGKEYDDWTLKMRGQIPAHADDGMLDHRGGYTVYSAGHSWGRLISHTQYHGDHPEYVALNEGSRVLRTANPFFCSSDPEVIAVIRKKAIDYFHSHPEAAAFSVSPSDWNFWCECVRCRALDGDHFVSWRGEERESMTDRVIHFTNEIAEAVPDYTIASFAYGRYVSPPVREKPLPNVVLTMWHSTPACYAHAIHNPQCPANTGFRECLDGWLDLGTGLFYGIYSTKSLWQQMPWPIAHRLAADLKYVHSRGVRWQRGMSHTPGRWGQMGYHIYLQNKLLWDITLDIDDVLNDYCRHSFGDAALHMRRYFDRMEEAASAPDIHFNNRYYREAPLFLTPELMAETAGYLHQAFTEAGTDDDRARVEMVLLAHEYARQMLEIIRLIQEYNDTQSLEAIAHAQTLFEQLVEFVKANSHKNAFVYFQNEGDVQRSLVEGWPTSGGVGGLIRSKLRNAQSRAGQ